MKKYYLILTFFLHGVILNAQTNTFPNSGSVGIGTINPLYKLDLAGNLFVRGSGNIHNNANSAELQVGYGLASAGTPGTVVRFAIQPYGHTGGPWLFKARDNASSAYLDISYGLDHALTIHHAGNVGIGTINPTSKLSVNGDIRAKEVKVETANWPDYVFTKDYELPSLQFTEKHIKDKGHLPGIPSAAEVQVNGVNLGEMNAKLLQKIEELTLYLIEIKKDADLQKKLSAEQINSLNMKIKKLENKNK